MALTTSPFLLKDLSFMLSLPAGTEVEYRCCLNAAALTPTAGGAGGVTYETFCTTHSGSTTNATWTCDLGGFQAYEDVTDLTRFCFTNEGEVADYLLVPVGGTISATNPGYQGQVTLVPTVIGGTANTFATFTISLPCTDKPTEIVAPPVGLFAAAYEDTRRGAEAKSYA